MAMSLHLIKTAPPGNWTSTSHIKPNLASNCYNLQALFDDSPILKRFACRVYGNAMGARTTKTK